MAGLDLVPDVTAGQSFSWDQTTWRLETGYGRQEQGTFHVVALDYGIKRNILRLLAEEGCRVTVLPASATAEEVLAQRPDGVFLSNGPGDPAATGEYAVPTIREIVGRACRLSASAWAIRCWAWPLGEPRPRCIRAITAPTTRSRTTRPARWRSCR
jgi:carbamoylphosphate synthase small subunit